MTPPTPPNQIEALKALIEAEVLRLHLKLRRYDAAQNERLEALEKAAGIPTPPRRPRR